jgi:hypothetical protein
MDRKTFEEPDLVTPRPKYSAYRNYDINIWSQDDSVINITAYRLSVYESDPEEVSGTDYDSEYFTWSLSTDHEPDWPALDWWVCDKLGLPDWTSLDGLDEWDTYHSDTADYLSGTTKPAPRAVAEWLDSLTEYEPRKV